MFLAMETTRLEEAPVDPSSQIRVDGRDCLRRCGRERESDPMTFDAMAFRCSQPSGGRVCGGQAHGPAGHDMSRYSIWQCPSQQP